MNQTILQMLRTLEESQKSRWKDHLNPLTHAYNCTKNSATNYSPFFLMFGRHPRIPLDVILGRKTQKPKNHEQYLQKWTNAIKEAYEIAKTTSDKHHKKDCDRRNVHATLGNLQAGDRILVRNLSERGGPGKLRSTWEKDVYVIVEPKGDVVYAVRKESDRDGKIRILHRNLLLPCNNLPITEITEQAVEQQTNAAPKLKKGRGERITSTKASKSCTHSELTDEIAVDPDDFAGLTPRQQEEFQRVLANETTHDESENAQAAHEAADTPVDREELQISHEDQVSDHTGESDLESFDSDSLDGNEETVAPERPTRERKKTEFLAYDRKGKQTTTYVAPVSFSKLRSTSRSPPPIKRRVHFNTSRNNPQTPTTPRTFVNQIRIPQQQMIRPIPTFAPQINYPPTNYQPFPYYPLYFYPNTVTQQMQPMYY